MDRNHFPAGARTLTPALALAVVLGLTAAPAALATTFCVPTLAACPGGTGVAKADLEEAMGTNGSDGVADTVYVAAGSYTENADFEPEPGSSEPVVYEPKGSDPLTVIGAGAGSTALTSAGTGNTYVINLGYNNTRQITLRDLRIEIPSTFTDNQGAGIFMYNHDRLEDVAVISYNEGATAVVAAGAGNVVRGGVIGGGGLEGDIDDAINVSDGTTTVEDATFSGVSWGLVATGGVLTARRILQSETRTYGAIAIAGTIDVVNSVFQIDDGLGIYASATANNSRVVADHLSVENLDGAGYPAIEVLKNTGAGNATVEVSNSILRGFGSGYKEQAAAGPGIGIATLKVRYSNFQKTGSANGVIDIATGNLDLDPLFGSGYALPANSPSVDAGDPGPGGLTTDFLGAPRPADGDGDGVAVRDQGAFELQPPSTPESGGSGGGGGGPPADTTPPQTKIAKGPGKKLAQGKAKFVFRSSEAGSTFACKLDKRKARPCRSPKKYSGLKPGRHTFKVWATDGAGNKDPTPAKRSFRVPA
jgi:hypothetical protein